MYDLLKTINEPSKLRKLERKLLPTLAFEIRNFLLDCVSQTGGHLSSNLGAVELTIALHYVFNTPIDRIVWDVGHQSYSHKILTGRRDVMQTLRQWGGISGFPRRSESEYDSFGTAHSSTSIAAALGVAVANHIKGKNNHAIAVIGDGAMSAGMAFEALNNAGVTDNISLIIILNDNNMSISPAVGALNRYLMSLISKKYLFKTKIQKNIFSICKILHKILNLKQYKKNKIISENLFEKFGFNYTGPINGHDFDSLIPVLENFKKLRGLQFLHVITRKGKGYHFAEINPILYHGLGKFNVSENFDPPKTDKKTYTQVFSEFLCDIAEIDDNIVGITPAMREGSGLVEFEKRFPTRYFDVGIAEQHAITFAGGLATEGMKPIVAIYSTFLQRGYDQLIHDIALQNLPVTFAIDRAGLVGADGATHAGTYDIAFMRCVPNMTIMAPSNENECRQMLYTAVQLGTPASVRYPRGTGIGVDPLKKFQFLPLGKAQIIHYRSNIINKFPRIAILAFGSMVSPALASGKILDATVVNMRFIKPIDTTLILKLAKQHDVFVTIEEGSIMGGAGSACIETLLLNKMNLPVLQLGLPDCFINHGDHSQLLSLYGLDVQGITKSISSRFLDLN